MVLVSLGSSPGAAGRLAGMLAERGDSEELRARADAGDLHAAARLPGLLVRSETSRACAGLSAPSRAVISRGVGLIFSAVASTPSSHRHSPSTSGFLGSTSRLFTSVSLLPVRLYRCHSAPSVRAPAYRCCMASARAARPAAPTG
jgi:hypothetical protein